MNKKPFSSLKPGATPEESIPWSLGAYENGLEIAASHRVIYRQRPDLQTVFPDPYRTSGNEPTFLSRITQTGPADYPEMLSAA